MKRLLARFKNSDGYTLGEIMVTTGILAILAAVAIPSYNAYVYKSRQSEAKNSLAGLYGAMIAFEAEHDTYTTRFDVNGFAVTGQLRYRTGFVVDKAPPPTVDNVGFGTCIITGTPAAKPACMPTYPQDYDITTGPAGASSISGFPGFAVTDTTFRAFSLGRADGINIDSWSIDHLGNLLRYDSGSAF